MSKYSLCNPSPHGFLLRFGFGNLWIRLPGDCREKTVSACSRTSFIGQRHKPTGKCKQTPCVQVTGPILQVRDNAIVVQKGNEKWEITRDKVTAMSGDLKVGAKVTICYTMQASKVEVKEALKKK